MTASYAPAVTDKGQGRTHHRADIQALRALAVGLVVIYHVAPGRLTGGFIGVDVFFVISGFLITGALVREMSRSGRVRLAAFWAQRARRLLPASLTALAVTLAAVVMWMPITQWETIARHVFASALYVENWFLAADSVDYLATDNAPTPVQHFWTLSVEEQFYLLWPLLFVFAGVFVFRKRMTVVRAGVAVIIAGSFVASVVLTASNPSGAYFFTHTRAWEFAAGALLAVLPALRANAMTRNVLAWAGIVTIVAGAFLISGDLPFPGATALVPVLGTMAVIVAKPEQGSWSPMSVGRLKPVQHIGDTSYSIYLWHWPVIILLPHVWDAPPRALEIVVVLIATLLLGDMSYRWLENPLRRSRFLKSRTPALTLGLAVLASGLVAGAALGVQSWVKDEIERQREAPQLAVEEPVDAAECRGGASAIDSEKCAEVEFPSVIPMPLAAQEDRPDTCMQGQPDPEVRVCESGVPIDEADEVVAVVGDSHSMHWIPAVRVVADHVGWHVVEILKGSCPLTEGARGEDGPVGESCPVWNDGVQEYLADRSEITRIFTSASAANPYVPLEDNPPAEVSQVVIRAFEAHPSSQNVEHDEAVAGVVGFQQAWDKLPDNIKHIYVLRDTPRQGPGVVDCMAELSEADLAAGALDCARSTDEAMLVDPISIAAELSGGRVSPVDIVTPLCDDVCPPVVGSVVAYRDSHHLTRTFALTFGPALGRSIGIDNVPAPDLAD